MILVTLGTQKQDFSRLLKYIEESNIKDEIIVQAGYTKFKSKKMILKNYWEKAVSFKEYMEIAKQRLENPKNDAEKEFHEYYE